MPELVVHGLLYMSIVFLPGLFQLDEADDSDDDDDGDDNDDTNNDDEEEGTQVGDNNFASKDNSFAPETIFKRRGNTRSGLSEQGSTDVW